MTPTLHKLVTFVEQPMVRQGVSRIPIVLVVFCFIALCLSCHQDSPSKSPSQSAIDYAEASTPDEAAKNYTRTFAVTHPRILEDARRDLRDDIALRASWRLAVIDALREHGDGASQRIDVSEFLADVHDRIPLKVPSWWADHVMTATLNSRGNPHFDPKVLKLLWSANRGLDVLATSKNVNVHNGSIVVVSSSGQVATPLAEPPRELVIEGGTPLASLLSGEKCYLARADDIPTPYNLYCYDLTDGRVDYQARVWAAGDLISYTGRGHHFIELRASAKAVYVFGAASDVVYIEAFRVTDRKCVLRFCTAY